MKTSFFNWAVKSCVSASVFTLSSVFESDLRSVLGIAQATMSHPIDDEFTVIFIVAILIFGVLHGAFIFFDKILKSMLEMERYPAASHILFSITLLILFCYFMHRPSLDPLSTTILVGIGLFVFPFNVGEYLGNKFCPRKTKY